MPEPTEGGGDGPLIVHLIGLESAETFHQVEGRGVGLNGKNARPAMEPLAPSSGISGAPLPEGGSFFSHDRSRSASVPKFT